MYLFGSKHLRNCNKCLLAYFCGWIVILERSQRDTSDEKRMITDKSVARNRTLKVYTTFHIYSHKISI